MEREIEGERERVKEREREIVKVSAYWTKSTVGGCNFMSEGEQAGKREGET